MSADPLLFGGDDRERAEVLLINHLQFDSEAIEALRREDAERLQKLTTEYELAWATEKADGGNWRTVLQQKHLVGIAWQYVNEWLPEWRQGRFTIKGGRTPPGVTVDAKEGDDASLVATVRMWVEHFASGEERGDE